MTEFFSNGENEIQSIFSSGMADQADRNRKLVRIQFWSGFGILQNVSFSADPNYLSEFQILTK
jgi:hypothetical protein